MTVTLTTRVLHVGNFLWNCVRRTWIGYFISRDCLKFSERVFRWNECGKEKLLQNYRNRSHELLGKLHIHLYDYYSNFEFVKHRFNSLFWLIFDLSWIAQSFFITLQPQSMSIMLFWIILIQYFSIFCSYYWFLASVCLGWWWWWC